jgi:pimeloyl-ACP methyl ester carboxylesterase
VHVLYLHGFASSPGSSKAGYLSAKLAGHGLALQAPDFNEPDFSTLTVTRMVGQVTGAIDRIPDGEVALIGSSLGGFVAVQAALQRPERVTRLVLLAPALDLRDLGDDSAEDWKATGWLPVFHYGFGRTIPVHYELYTDAVRYDSLNARLDIPIQIFQGRRDTAVDPAIVQRWANARPKVELHLLDDDHQLLASLEYIWGRMRRFLHL